MAKRPLGLGKAAKSKKQKPEEAPAASTELTVELNEAADANDELAQLVGLWGTFVASPKDNQLILNGIIHECDRLLRNYTTDNEGKVLPDTFHAIYASALGEMTKFLEEEKEIDEFFTTAEERIETGLEQYPQSVALLFAQAKLYLSRIPLGYVSRMDLESTTKEFPKISTLLDKALDVYEAAEMQAELLKDYSCFTAESFEILEVYDDLLDFIDNFGRNTADGLDSDEESEEEEEIELSKKHPLKGIKEDDKYNLWWREHVETFLGYVDLNAADNGPLRREICKRLGQSYLMEAEEPSQIFTTLTYENPKEYPDLDVREVQKDAIKLVEKAIGYLKQAEASEEPQSWVDVAEAQITLANLHDNESAAQEATYKLAEERLVRANKATHGKFEDILKNLLGGDSDLE